MAASNTNYCAGRSPLLDVSYGDRIGAAEMLSLNSSHMCTNDGTVDLVVCTVVRGSMLHTID
jgi:hypothetical protein